MSSISCIIPFLNEETRIGAVLNEVIKVKNISQIIAVDGGSTDHGCDFVKKNFPQVELIKMNLNQGKTETVRKGLKTKWRIYSTIRCGSYRLEKKGTGRNYQLRIKTPGSRYVDYEADQHAVFFKINP